MSGAIWLAKNFTAPPKIRPYVPRVAQDLGITVDIPVFYVTIEPKTEGARIFAWASVVDNVSSDQYYVPQIRID